MSEPVPRNGTSFVLTDGVERDVCGIGLLVTFVPPSTATGDQTQAFLVGGPVGAVHASPSQDRPLPANVAPARIGTTVTVLGRRFTVSAVDRARRRVTVEAEC